MSVVSLLSMRTSRPPRPIDPKRRLGYGLWRHTFCPVFPSAARATAACRKPPPLPPPTPVPSKNRPAPRKSQKRGQKEKQAHPLLVSGCRESGRGKNNGGSSPALSSSASTPSPLPAPGAPIPIPSSPRLPHPAPACGTVEPLASLLCISGYLSHPPPIDSRRLSLGSRGLMSRMGWS